MAAFLVGAQQPAALLALHPAHSRRCRPPAATASSVPPVAVFTSDVCLEHEPGWLNLESPKRLSTLLSALRTEWAPEFGERLQIHEPEADVTREQLLRIHSPEHLALVDSAFDRAGSSFLQPRVALDADTVVSAGSRAACERATGLVVAAVDHVCGGGSAARRAFCMVRPPGHHAEPRRPMGFCLYNNLMVGVAHAQAVHDIGRVAILDPDVHHGNGDAACVWGDASRLYASTHQRGLFPSGLSAYTPEGAAPAGEFSNVLSCPLPAGSGSEAFRAAWADKLLPAVAAFEPEAIFLSTGFDAHAAEEVASLGLVDDDFAWLTSEIATLGGGDLPIVSVLEGGYNLEVLPRAAKAHVAALIGTSSNVV